ncbi:MAG: AbrB/MazE/SpoVT family DNA-binding domain-containing protein [Clostridia bacterium]|nr:AbrB/MazE/SpoVT family DNA-binding domain-containing protein [Clostridia bacterium]
MITTKIDKLGRIVIPASYRQALGIRENDTLIFSLEGEAVVIRAASRSCRLCGALIEPNEKVSLCPDCIRRIKALS